jgi:ferric-dicitrate binding protein FerR (iron transport regulator)
MDSTNRDSALAEAARHSARLSAHDCSWADRDAAAAWRAAKAENEWAFQTLAGISEKIQRAIASDRRMQELAARACASSSSENTLPNSSELNFAKLRRRA